MRYISIRKALLEAVANASEANLIRLSAGNISTRCGDELVAITASGVAYRTMTTEDISIVDLDGNVIEGPKPSSELPMHNAIYRQFPNVGSIFHTHSPYAITFAMLGKEVPRANLELMTCGAPIPVAPWACPGTARGGEVSVEILRQRPELKVILLRKHGLVAVGTDLDQAFKMAYNLEFGLQCYYQALQLGQPEMVTDKQVAEIMDVYYPQNVDR